MKETLDEFLATLGPAAEPVGATVGRLDREGFGRRLTAVEQAPLAPVREP